LDFGNMIDSDACPACQAAACGDGFVQQGVEACDDGNADDGDGCSAACELEALRVFVSSATWKGDLGGLAGADAKCQALALDAMLGGVWMAWLSDDDAGPADRFTTKGGSMPYVLVDGVQIADDWADLVDGDLDGPIHRTETGAMSGGSIQVWTNTDIAGNPSSIDKFCADWSDPGGGASGDFGDRTVQDGNWTKKGSGGCNTACHLYCFEQ
jgi:cysteine-rich repeat protein